MSDLQAILLIGGRGTRLSALYGDRPKALAPVAGRPFIEWQIEWLRKGGIHRVHLAAGHMAGQIEHWARSGVFPDVDLTVSCEPAPLGTGGGIKFCEPWIRSDPFYVLNGDSLTPALDFQSLEKSFQKVPTLGKTGGKSSNPWNFLTVSRIREAGRYGTVEFDSDGKVTGFLEKAQRTDGWINAGVYLLSRQILADIAPGAVVSTETDLFPRWTAQGLLRAFKAPPPMLDMGTPEGIREMEAFLT